jgi:hypothetical protein
MRRLDPSLLPADVLKQIPLVQEKVGVCGGERKGERVGEREGWLYVYEKIGSFTVTSGCVKTNTAGSGEGGGKDIVFSDYQLSVLVLLISFFFIFFICID